jgi:ElaB/YqjD/DUF883 family membrane-anchored ribosome-binding protein
MAEKKTTATAPAKRASPAKAKAKAALKPTTMLSAPVGETLRDQAGSFKDKAGDKAREYANTGKDKATDLLDSLSQTVTDLAKSVDERLGTSYGDYARKAADAVSGAAGTLKDKDIDDLVADTREFVRKQPAIAIGAAAAVGFLLTRLVKAGSNDRDDA